ncbi:MAG: NADH-quinone oxidoreductase subunit L [Phycisphaerae bacterium]
MLATLLILATLLPLLAFGVLAAVGRRMGSPLAGIVGIVIIAGSFVCSLAAMIVWLSLETASGTAPGAGGQPYVRTLDWIPAGKSAANNGWLQVGIHVDSLTIVMFTMVTLVATLVFVFSLGYMRDDKRFARYYTYLSLFCFSMLGLVLGSTLLQIFIFWELVGLCSYLLIGFWYEKKPAAQAAFKAFVVNRVGDVGFLIGIGILFYCLGNVSLLEVYRYLGSAGSLGTDQAIVLPAAGASNAGAVVSAGGANTITVGLLTVVGLCLFLGAAGKSAQFPLHNWLPDAMEGPTPVSALIHAATMVAAGVYLLARVFPILTPDAKLVIAIVGCVTLAMGALIAVAQTDIKRLLAYSTVSQLGYMVLAIGVGSWTGALFHLYTHAFFKALLFLGAGSVIDAAGRSREDPHGHVQELGEMGGLWRKIPYTALLFGVGVLAIAGTPLLAGYASKHQIIGDAGAFAWLARNGGGGWGYWLLFWTPVVVAYLTAFYMARCWMLAFAGKPRNERVYAGASEEPLLVAPLVVLGVLSVIAGNEWFGVPTFLRNAQREATNYFERPRAVAGSDAPAPPLMAKFGGFATAWQSRAAYSRDGEMDGELAPAAAESKYGDAHHAGERLAGWATWAFLAGIGLAVIVYRRGFSVAERVLRAVRPLRWVQVWLYRRMYFDELYRGVVVTFARAAAHVAAIVDRYLIDGLVNLVASVTRRAARAAGRADDFVVDGAVAAVAQSAVRVGTLARSSQTGRIRVYVLALIAVVAVAVAVGIVVAMSL